jgi:uncharacterized protein YgbK (DUF1537 family)
VARHPGSGKPALVHRCPKGGAAQVDCQQHREGVDRILGNLTQYANDEYLIANAEEPCRCEHWRKFIAGCLLRIGSDETIRTQAQRRSRTQYIDDCAQAGRARKA